MNPSEPTITCKCGWTSPLKWTHFEYGQDTYVDERNCNGISCGYYGCPEEFCYSDYPNVEVKKTFLRYTCQGCELSVEILLDEEVSKA